MAAFESKVCEIRVEEHPNADQLELAIVGEYRCVVRKGEFATGDLVAYIPESAICPDDLIEEMGLTGRLSGSQKNRVKAVRLRGIVSQGLVYPVTGKAFRGMIPNEGEDVTETLGIVKYEPQIPTLLKGEVETAYGNTLHYDIENIKKFPNVFGITEELVFTEKIHGTWCCLGHHPDHPSPIVTSKGQSSKGLVLKHGEMNVNNLYMRTWAQHCDAFEKIRQHAAPDGQPFYLLGEIYGRGVQDLHYGEEKPMFRVFDAFVGYPNDGRPYPGNFLCYDDLVSVVNGMVPMVPLLYRGRMKREALEEHTNGKTALGGGNVREGIVIRPVRERDTLAFGRVILKSVSDAYLLRKNATEFE